MNSLVVYYVHGRFQPFNLPAGRFDAIEKGGANRLARTREKISLTVERLTALSK